MSTRDYEGDEVPATLVAEGPVRLGADAALPGRFERTGFRVSEALQLRAGRHRFKLGGAVRVATFDHTYAFGRFGRFFFGDAGDLAQGRGVFVQTVGPLPVARFTTSQAGFFLQDTWRAIPGFDVTAGLRIDVEHLPDDEVRPNDEWARLTGLDNAAFDGSMVKVSPRLGLRWDVGNRRLWVVQAEFGTYHGLVEPGIVSELATHSGATEIRRGIGDLGGWPAAPDSAAAPVVGSALTLLGPEFRAPRSRRASFGISASLGKATTGHLAAVYRHTDFLPRRHDLNLNAAPTGRDQYGRPIYGTLTQEGSLVAAVPGSNRRFGEFDLVSALDPDGSSDYWGVTVRVERRFADRLNLLAAYTYSRTEDNWLSGRGGGPDGQLTPFPDSLNGVDWADGRSDFDVPHRVVLGAELDFGLVRFAGFYRFQSGAPFTPGFRPGVDANGDGAFANDPAFVDDQIPGVTDLFASWDCLREQVGRFAERNACRGPGVHTVDVRCG